MAKKPNNEDVSLDMTPMIDVVFELIIFFVVTLTEATAGDETVRLKDGRNGIELTPEELPPTHLIVDVAKNGRISMCDVTITPEELGRRVKERMRRFGEFPVLIRADYRTRHEHIARVMGACTANGIWKISFVAIKDRKSERSKKGK